MKKIIYQSVISTFLLFGGCSLFEEKTDDDPNDKLFEGKKVRAEIKLPEGLSSINPETLKVESNVDSSPVSNGEFGLDSEGDFTTLFASYPNDEVALMGYVYPGASDLNISPRSTALAMVMMTPAVLNLSSEGKKNLITKIENDPGLQVLESEIVKNLTSGKSLLDENNAGISNAMVQLFVNATARLTNEEKELPVNTFRAGRNFSFNNKGSAISTVIGIYKDDNFVGKVIVEGITIVPSSLQDLFAGLGNKLNTPVDKNFSLQGDGNFTLKYRTGRPGSSSGTEHDEAFYENLYQFSFSLISALSPFQPSETCLAEIRQNTIETITTISGLKENPSIGNIFYTVSSHTIGKIETLYGCAGKKIESKWYEKFNKFLGFISKPFDLISNGANITIFSAQWAATNPAIDVCYIAKGNEVSEGCEQEEDTFTDPRDGNIYKIIKIGEQTWFAENLRYGKDIPQISSKEIWNSINNNGNPLDQPGWAYYNNDESNDPTYGKLYNWSAVNKQVLCPSGWHIPSTDEWEVLINFLGGPNVAGGKMKTTTGWITPNIGATNESGFSVMPGGYRHPDGTFNDLGSTANFWSSTEDFSYSAWLRNLGRADTKVYKYGYGKAGGLSCRCLKDNQ